MKKILTVLVLALAVTAMAFAGGKGDKDGSEGLVFATDATWPPMEYVDENGVIVGFDVDLAAALSAELGVEITLQNTAWDGIFAGLANDAYDAVISSVTITDERKEAMDFTMPYINAGQILIVAADASGISSLDDMVGMKVGTQMGTTGDFAVEKAEGVVRKAYDEVGLAVEDLINGNIDGVVCDSPIAADFVSNNPAYSGKLKIVGKPFTDEYLGIAVKKGNTELVEALNAALKTVIDNGTRDDLVDKWLR